MANEADEDYSRPVLPPTEPGFADGPPVSPEQQHQNRQSFEAFLDEMMGRQKMDDSHIRSDRPDPNVRGNVVTPNAYPDAESGPHIQFADPGFGPKLRAQDPREFDPGFNPEMDYLMEVPSDHITRQGMEKYDAAEQLVQQMIHQNLRNRKFR